MINFAFLSTVATIAMLAGQSLAQEQSQWPIAADIPAVDDSVLNQKPGSIEAELASFYKVAFAEGGTISPDGSTIAYYTFENGVPQLRTVPAAGGTPKQLTSGGTVTDFYWTRDSKGLVYFADIDGNELSGMTYLAADGSSQRVITDPGEAFTIFGDFSSDGTQMIFASTKRNGDDYDLYIQDMNGGDAKKVYQGRYEWLARAWQPGGPYVVVTETRGSDAEDLYLFNAKTKRMINVYNPKVAAYFGQFEWRSDGSGFYMTTNLGREYQGLAYYDMKSGELTRLENPDADIDRVSLGGKDRYIAWVVNEGGYSKLHARDLKTNDLISLPELPKGVYGIEIAENAPVLKLSISSPQIPEDIWTYNFETETLTRATTSDAAGLDLAKMVYPESVTFKAQDGVDLFGLYYAPREGAMPKEGKPPVVIYLHGGPTDQAKPYFVETIQYLAARGYAVLDLNYRGSTGFGKTFARLDDMRKRTNAVRDIKDAMTWLKASGRVDTQKAGVMGESYGGYLVNAVLGDYPDLFAAGVSAVGVSDWVRALEEASPSLKASDRLEYGDITDPEDRKFFASISPINNAEKIKTPVLVQHGANDPRDPVTESDSLVQKIRDAGGSAEYIRLKDEGHFIRKLNNTVYTYLRIGAFLDKHLMGIEVDVPATTPEPVVAEAPTKTQVKEKVAAQAPITAPEAAKVASDEKVAAPEDVKDVIAAQAPAKAKESAVEKESIAEVVAAPPTEAEGAKEDVVAEMTEETAPEAASQAVTETVPATVKEEKAPVDAAAGALVGTSGAIAALAEADPAPTAAQLEDVQAAAKAKQAAIEDAKKAEEARKALAAAQEKAAQARAAADKAAAALKTQEAATLAASQGAAEAEKTVNSADVAIAKAQASAVEAKDAKAKAEAMLKKAEADIAASAKALTDAQAAKADAQKTLEAATKTQAEEQAKMKSLKEAAQSAEKALEEAQSALGGGAVTVDKGLLEKASDIVKSVVDKVTGEASP